MKTTITMTMTRQQASALHSMILCYYLESRKEESSLPREWINVMDDTSVSVDELLKMLTDSVIVSMEGRR